jgi:hypothetical protein
MSATKSKLILAPYSIQKASTVMRGTIRSINDCLGQEFPIDADLLSFDETYFPAEFRSSQTMNRSSGKTEMP